MFFDLSIRKFKNLKAITIRSLCCLSLGKIIDNLLIGVCLLNVLIIKIDNGISIWVSLPPYPIGEYHLLFAVQEGPLDLAIVAHDLLLDGRVVRVRLIMVLARELHFVVLLFFPFSFLSLLVVRGRLFFRQVADGRILLH